jgi:methylisocitrate lyase
MTAANERIRTFHQLHRSGCFVIPNPWDVGSARLLVRLGFPALATTSSGFAWSLGRPDNGVTLNEALEHFTALAANVPVPVSADFEGGFGVTPAAVAGNVARIVTTGIAGFSIEDASGDPAAPLVDAVLSVERIRAAREAIDQSGTGVLLVARSEGFIAGRPDLAETIRRLTAFADAGADCLYAPGLRTIEEITEVVRAVAPKPVNVLAGNDRFTVEELAAAGVRRISVGGSLARTAWTGMLNAAREIAERGTFTSFRDTVPYADMNRLFESD